MRRALAIAFGIALGLVGSAVAIVAVAQTGPGVKDPGPAVGPPVGPRVARNDGAGELLIAVVGGVYPSRAEAEAANDQMRLGDVQGYYVVPVAQFQGFREQVGEPGDFALVTVFRTEQGAAEFVDVAVAMGLPAVVLPDRVRSLGGLYAGLGQERNPEGTGPLLGPIPESLPQDDPSAVPSPTTTSAP